MTLSPNKLRDSLAATVATGGRCIAVSVGDAPVLIEALEGYDACCRSVIFECCAFSDETCDWLDTASCREDGLPRMERALAYLEGRQLIERDGVMVRFLA